MKEKLKSNDGITLIALVVTIIVLIILATISVRLVISGKIIKRAEQSSEIQQKAVLQERLELIKGSALIANQGKVTVESYIREAVKEGIADESKIGEENEDGSKDFVTENEWNVNVAPDSNNPNNVIITVDGKVGYLKPAISTIKTITTKGSMTIKANVRHLNGGTVEYYYKLSSDPSEEAYVKIENITEEGAVVEGLTEGASYDIKVVAINANGTEAKGKKDVAMKVSVSKITLNAKSTRMAAGYIKTIIATVEPENAENKELEWTTTDSDIATVENKGTGAFGVEGNVKSLSGKSGKVTITAKAKDGSGITASCEVDVVIADEIKTIVGNTTASDTNRILCDQYGNLITVPADFIVVANGGNTKVDYKYTGNASSPSVQDGIVIQDKDGNQFTWVPAELVQNKEGDEKGPSKNIVLGRYTFDEEGKETLQQDAENWEDVVTIEQYYQELPDFREGIIATGENGRNATARNLKGFVQKTKANSGYYMGRYEASYRSGTSKANYIPYCKQSTSATEANWANTPGRLWTRVNQINAAAACRNMYQGKEYYESDLINSYAWDTAIIFIQTYSNDDQYSRRSLEKTGKVSNTGSTEDMVCNIYDMSCNVREMTTEYSLFRYAHNNNPLSTVVRGENSTQTKDTDGSSTRYYWSNTSEVPSTPYYGFRPLLYFLK